MPKNKVLLISVITTAFAVISSLLLLMFLHTKKAGETGGFKINTLFEKILQENQQLKEAILQAERKINQLESSLKNKEQEIFTLSNTQPLKQALTGAQNTITQLTRELEQLKNDKASLEDKYFTVNSRLQSVTQELTRTLEEKKLTQQELVELKKKNIPQAPSPAVVSDNKPNIAIAEKDKQIKLLQSDLSGKENQIKSFQAELAKLDSARRSLEGQLVQKDKYIEELGSLNQNLKSQITRLPRDLSEREQELSRQNRELVRLRDELDASQEKLGRMQNELNLRENELLKVKDELISQTAKSKMPVIPAEEGIYKQQWEETKRLYEAAKGQIAQFSEILVTKEIELGSQKKEAAVLKQQVSELQSKIEGLNNELKTAHSGNQNIKALETEKLRLQAQYLQAQEDLRKQNELIASLTNALDALNKKIAQSEEGKKNLEMSLAKENVSKDSLEGELEKQKKRIDELNNFYGGLKTQIVQFSNLLTDKESELNQKQKDVSALKDEITYQQSKVTRLEKELAETKERQKKIFENLSQATDLNTALQESLSGAAQSLEQDKNNAEYKKKAEELRRKIEVILTPESSP